MTLSWDADNGAGKSSMTILEEWLTTNGNAARWYSNPTKSEQTAIYTEILDSLLTNGIRHRGRKGIGIKLGLVKKEFLRRQYEERDSRNQDPKRPKCSYSDALAQVMAPLFSRDTIRPATSTRATRETSNQLSASAAAEQAGTRATRETSSQLSASAAAEHAPDNLDTDSDDCAVVGIKTCNDSGSRKRSASTRPTDQEWNIANTRLRMVYEQSTRNLDFFMAKKRAKEELVNKFDMTEEQAEQELEQSIAPAREEVDRELGRSRSSVKERSS